MQVEQHAISVFGSYPKYLCSFADIFNYEREFFRPHKTAVRVARRTKERTHLLSTEVREDVEANAINDYPFPALGSSIFCERRLQQRPN